MTADLIPWLHEQIREDVRRAEAEAASKLAILDEHTCECPFSDCEDCGACSGPHHGDPTSAPCQTVRFMGVPYAARPGYDESWRPA